ncbi:hypothetical protein D3C72_2092700 [compost metagenome]
MKDDVIVLFVLRLRVVEFARLVGPFALFDAERTGHAEMSDHGRSVVQIDQQVFGATGETDDLPAGQPCDEIARQGKAQVGTTQLDPLHHRPFHGRRKPSSDRLDLWQFRHRIPSFRLNGA